MPTRPVAAIEGRARSLGNPAPGPRAIFLTVDLGACREAGRRECGSWHQRASHSALPRLAARRCSVGAAAAAAAVATSSLGPAACFSLGRASPARPVAAQLAPMSAPAAMRPMAAGDGEHSYDSQSYLQAAIFAEAKPMLLEHIANAAALQEAGGVINIADLGCSTGRNSVQQMTSVVSEIRRLLFDSQRECFVYFSDLPDNDFNLLLRLLFDQESGRPAYFAAAVPGSFYNRLFPVASLHVVTCTLAMHFLSQDPFAATEAGISEIVNTSSTWYARDESGAILSAYQAQAKRDLECFLTCRAEEIRQGGLLWMITAGGPEPDHDGMSSENSAVPAAGGEMDKAEEASRNWFDLMDEAWKQLIAEGAAPAESMASFNIPLYGRSESDFHDVIENLPGKPFAISLLKRMGVTTPQEWQLSPLQSRPVVAKHIVTAFTVILGPLLTERFGRGFLDQLAHRMEHLILQDFECYATSPLPAIVCLALIRR
eukprot:SM000388S14664  [mRNA]  locus=s388:55105:58145:+ [translate_table: standard]